jgi:1-deoxy-D-xylulose-5-phosphate synthase
MWDLALLGVVPGLRVAAPRDAGSLRGLLREAVGWDRGPTALRFPKGKTGRELPALGRVGAAEVLVAGQRADVLLLPVGPLAGTACAAASELERFGLSVTVVDPRWVQPVEPALLQLAARSSLVVTLEDGVVSGGFGDAVARGLRSLAGPAARMPDLLTLGLPPQFVEHGRREDLLAAAGLDVPGVVHRVRAARGVRPATPVPA